ncbi:MAG: mannose-1-phosphate guanylyltransferase/mannose-6-phosphate isomerase [Bdellovibrionales bacterium]|nr:mannose-1-phosphate guanylyltransferase/mannose-6-phosphate isomerase [Bdellovibrionales bacterium]
MVPMILSGGSGTRLWPVSRESFPKQFCDLFDESLIQKTVRRLKPLGSPWVITTTGMKTLTERLYRDLSLPAEQILAEPFGRNTAAAIALACRQLQVQGREKEVVGIFPADHFVENEKAFQAALATAEKAALEGKVVTLGIQPTFPATGYGYIEIPSGSMKPGKPEAVKAVRFREKPDLKTAEGFLKTGNYVWNAGVFIFRADRMIDELKKLLPDVWGPFEASKNPAAELKSIYEKVPSISIDYGVMEKLPEFFCIPCTDLGWNDVGSWDEVAKITGKSEAKVIEIDAQDNFAFSAVPQKKSYSFIGINSVIAVDTPDALLLVKKGQSQKVKDAQAAAKEAKLPEATQHEFEYRPWGYFEILRDTDLFKSKVIRVDPGQQLSYQSHAKRAEHWVVVRGNPEVVLNDEVLKPKPGEHIYIPLGAKHRMRNPTKEMVEFVEVQVGSYFGEDDIVRYQDDYKRN